MDLGPLRACLNGRQSFLSAVLSLPVPSGLFYAGHVPRDAALLVGWLFPGVRMPAELDLFGALTFFLNKHGVITPPFSPLFSDRAVWQRILQPYALLLFHCNRRPLLCCMY